ncbi:MAG: hypothetical protein EXR39_02575 [Betaproteobacteria bacterium]|nr:hypothetical protein [Betaproteobacteria bacterium]
MALNETADRATALPAALSTTADERSVVRFITAGSVDDGKSTLIGRLLHDTCALADDQLAALERVSSKRGHEGVDLSLLTDGLEAEREQGITIDVAYRYFATPKRKFIWVGSRYRGTLPERPVRMCLALVLLVIGLKLVS